MDQFPVPGPLSFDGNVSENRRKWKLTFDIYMVAVILLQSQKDLFLIKITLFVLTGIASVMSNSCVTIMVQ